MSSKLNSRKSCVTMNTQLQNIMDLLRFLLSRVRV